MQSVEPTEAQGGTGRFRSVVAPGLLSELGGAAGGSRPPLRHRVTGRPPRGRTVATGASRAAPEVPRLSDVTDPDGAQEPIPVTGVSELVLEVVDLDRSLRFYSEVLGLPVVARWEDSERAWVMAGERTRIGLWRPQVGLAGGRGGVHVHYAFHLDESAFDAALARLRAFGYEPVQHAFEGHGRAAYGDDPDK